MNTSLYETYLHVQKNDWTKTAKAEVSQINESTSALFNLFFGFIPQLFQVLSDIRKDQYTHLCDYPEC